MYKGNFFFIELFSHVGEALQKKFSSKEQLVVVVCLLCYCNIQAGFPHGTINKGKSDDHYNGKVWEM